VERVKRKIVERKEGGKVRENDQGEKRKDEREGLGLKE
jgi:hypothetical protein